jgi:microcystin degradation protein MlrC
VKRWRPRIAVVGISVEASTFSPARTREEDFTCRVGSEIADYYPFLADGHPVGDSAQWDLLVHYRSLPGGAVPETDFARMCRRVLDALTAGVAAGGAYDGVLLDLHGAMSVVGPDGQPRLDPEGELAEQVRLLVGSQAMMSTGMDLHGNVSERLARSLDLLTCYRTAPHEDWLDTKERSARTLVDELAKLRAGGVRPLKARAVVPILLPGEMTSTRTPPADRLYAMVEDVAGLPDIVDAGIWIGYPWADEPRNHATVVVVGQPGADPASHASRIARHMWEARREFQFAAPAAPLDECLAVAFAATDRPFFVSDSGDNPTAGGAGDVTWTLGRLLERPETASGRSVVYASIPDARAVASCVEAGVGAEVAVEVGAVVDSTVSPPVRLAGTVQRITDGDPVGRTEVVLRVGTLEVILTQRRKPFHLLGDFIRNGIDVTKRDVVVVKIGYLEPELYDAAAGWMLALTPGCVDQDLQRLGHKRIRRPMFPWDRDMPDPDLSAVLVTR